jgi:hypothetical protein
MQPKFFCTLQLPLGMICPSIQEVHRIICCISFAPLRPLAHAQPVPQKVAAGYVLAGSAR